MNAYADAPVSSSWRAFFLVAALYDLLLGAAFVVFGEQLLSAIGMELPPHVAYIQLAAVFIFVQGLSYALVYRDPLANLGIVRVGVAYKAAYAGLALWYLVVGLLPSIFFLPWAAIDLAFLVGFVLFLRAAGRDGSSAAPHRAAPRRAATPRDRRGDMIHEALHRPVPGRADRGSADPATGPASGRCQRGRPRPDMVAWPCHDRSAGLGRSRPLRRLAVDADRPPRKPARQPVALRPGGPVGARLAGAAGDRHRARRPAAWPGWAGC